MTDLSSCLASKKMKTEIAILFVTLLVVVLSGQSQATTSDFTDVVNINVTPVTPQQLFSAAVTEFQQLLALEKTKANAILSALKSLQSVDADVAEVIGTDIANGFFLEGTEGIAAAAQFIITENDLMSNIMMLVYQQFPVETTTAYKKCAPINTVAAELPSAVASVNQVIAKTLTAEINFESAGAKCLTSTTVPISTCLATAASNNLPKASDQIVDTKSFVSRMYECITTAVFTIRYLGSLTISNFYQTMAPHFTFILPKNFDPNNKNISAVPDFVSPVAKLEALTTLVAQTKKQVLEAVNGKAAGLASAKAYLAPVLNETLGIVDGIPVQTSTKDCIVTARSAVESNFAAKALAISQCVGNVVLPPNLQEVALLETALLDRKVKEELLVTWAQCASKTRNAFDSYKLQCCIAEAQDDLNFFLDGVKFSLEVILRKSTDIKLRLNQCAVTGQRSFQKQFTADSRVLDKCLKKNTKIVVERPVN